MSIKKLLGIFAAVMMCAVVIALSGCGSQETNEAFNADETLKKLLEDVRYEAELEDVSEYAGFTFSDVADGVDIKMYAAGGKLNDQVIFFKAGDASAAEGINNSVKTYIESLKNEAKLYNPEEVTKLDNAVIRTYDNCVFVCITNDVETAGNILK